MMADNRAMEFDIWVLQSVILANIDGKGTTERILAAADLMSKMPMAEADLRGGLARLARRGLIDQRDGQYTVTAAVPENIKWSEKEKIRRLLEAEPTATDKKAASTDDLGKLASDYVKRFQGFISGLTKPRKE
jgi:hypothetical protein